MDDHFRDRAPDPVTAEVQEPLSVEAIADEESHLPEVVKQHASGGAPINLPRICYVPGDPRSIVVEMCSQHLRPHYRFESENVLSIARLCSQLALTTAVISGNAELTMRRAVLHQKSTDAGPLVLDPELLRRDQLVCDDKITALFNLTGADKQSVRSKAVIAAVSLDRQMFEILHRCIKLLDEQLTEFSRRRVKKIDVRIRRIHMEIKSRSLVYLQDWLCQEYPHLKQEDSIPGSLLRQFNILLPYCWDYWRDFGTPEWHDHLGFLPVTLGEDPAEYQRVFTDTCETLPGHSWFEAFMVKLLVDLSWIETRLDQVQEFLLCIAGGSPEVVADGKPLEQNDLHGYGRVQSVQFGVDNGHARYLALRMHEEGVTIVEIRDVSTQVEKAKRALLELLEREGEAQQKLEDKLADFRIAGQKYVFFQDLKNNGLA